MTVTFCSINILYHDDYVLYLFRDNNNNNRSPQCELFLFLFLFYV